MVFVWVTLAPLTTELKIMKIIDSEDNGWFLFEHKGKLYLDVNCSQSFFGYSWMIELNESELHQYHLEGREYLNLLSQHIHNSAPIAENSQSVYKERDVTEQFSALVSDAIKTWKSSNT